MIENPPSFEYKIKKNILRNENVYSHRDNEMIKIDSELTNPLAKP